jgi:hypothetical protein
MSDRKNVTQTVPKITLGRRDFLSAALGGLLAALTGCIYEPPGEEDEDRLSALEARVSQLEQQLAAVSGTQPLGYLEGGMNERVVFEKSELTVTNPEGVLLNLVATDGGVGIRFYKDFGFGNELVDGPWSMWIEWVAGYQGLALLRDWQFTAALWDEDGKLLLGRLHPHPPANDPAGARLHVRGTVDEVQTIIEGSADQTADIFQVRGAEGAKHLAVNSAGQLVVGSKLDPKELIFYDTRNGHPYAFKVTNGQPTLTPV